MQRTCTCWPPGSIALRCAGTSRAANIRDGTSCIWFAGGTWCARGGDRKLAFKAAVVDVHDVAADLATADGGRNAADAARRHLGGMDILIHVVGGSSSPAGGFAALDDAQWSREFDLNLMSAVRLERALLLACSRRVAA